MASGKNCAISDESISDAKSLTTTLVSSIKRDGKALRWVEDKRRFTKMERYRTVLMQSPKRFYTLFMLRCMEMRWTSTMKCILLNAIAPQYYENDCVWFSFRMRDFSSRFFNFSICTITTRKNTHTHTRNIPSASAIHLMAPDCINDELKMGEQIRLKLLRKIIQRFLIVKWSKDACRKPIFLWVQSKINYRVLISKSLLFFFALNLILFS